MIDLPVFIESIGYIGLAAVIFAESGLFFGFFLPGDSLIFTAGILAAGGFGNIAILFVLLTVAAILGDNVGYATGKKFGPKIFNKENSIFFDRKHIERAETFFRIHGPKSIILARFVPVVRTFTPILAGVGSMDYKTFLRYNIAGGILWIGSLSFLGYSLGKTIPNIDRYLLPIIGGIIFISFIPVAKEYLQKKFSKR